MKKTLILLGIFVLVVIASVLIYFFVYKNLTQKFEYNGKLYRPEEGFMHEDGCNTCSFDKKGSMLCTLIACNVDDGDSTGDEQVYIDFTYENGKYLYSGTVQKPTPCDTVEVNAVIRESFPEQVTFAITTKSSDQICAQVITEEEISGEIAVSEQAVIEVTLNGEAVEGAGIN